MKLVVATPRLLPLTILAMAALLGLKSVALVRAASPAGSTETPPPKPVEAKPADAKADAPPPPAMKPAEAVAPKVPLEPPISMSERMLLLDLRKRRAELDAREAALVAREAVLAAAETRLTARVGELSALQKRLEALEAARHDHDEANWRGLVKLYEAMKPRDAAAIFNDLDMSVLLPVVDRMKETKAALVLAAMLPDRARQLTAELAQARAKANTVPAAAKGAAPPATTASTPPSAKANGGG